MRSIPAPESIPAPRVDSCTLRSKLPFWPSVTSDTVHIRVRVNNEKNGGVKKAPQARGGRPLRSINVSYPFVCHFHPLQLYVSRLPK